MGIYWSLSDVPELASLPRDKRRRVHEACLRKYIFNTRATGRTIIAYLMLVIAGPAVAILSLDILAPLFGAPIPNWVTILTLVVGASLGWFLFSRLLIPHLRRFYLDYIQNELANLS